VRAFPRKLVRRLRCPNLLATAIELSRLPSAKIEMAGDDECRRLFLSFTRRHERLKVIQNKRWGVALLAVPERFDDYFRDPKRAHLRREFSRASRAGLTFAAVDPLERFDDILAINRSAVTRQGQPMHPHYLDETRVRRYFERSADVFGVTDAGGTLRAYVAIRVSGEVACVERILGHADVLNMGVMWVLVTGTIRELVERKQTDGRPTWFMYDTYFGASAGLRQFKQWVGFAPYRVSWSWRS
jgi:hypothetical protein